MFGFKTRHRETMAAIGALHRHLAIFHSQTEGMLMPLTNQVKRLVEEVTKMKDINAASASAMSILMQQAADARTQLADLKSKLPSENSEDVAALEEAINTIHDSAAQLQAAIPANTVADETGKGDPVQSSDSSGSLSGDAGEDDRGAV